MTPIPKKPIRGVPAEKAPPASPPPTPPAPLPTIEEAREALLVEGDYAKISKQARQAILLDTCQKLGLDPTTRPLAFLSIDGKLLLYAFKSCSDGLAKVQRLSDVSLDIKDLAGGGAIYQVRVADQAWLESGGTRGRSRIGVGAVPPGLQGTSLANAHKKAETQAHRRAILGMCAPGLLDESEVEDIPGSRRAETERMVGTGATEGAKTRAGARKLIK